uniref:Uncharacterized protein n=1 Tax=Populus alba TaxID=43335 RepID=A0A4U5P790_POPAL|nr:hypothetical protein D5086_0000221560 [Populus alba]
MDMAPWIRVLVLVACLFPASVESMVRHYKFNVVMKNSTKLCSTKPIVTVNGQFPGPTLVAREDDTVLVKVVNHVKYNVSIHWHGVRQLRTGWADGPAYITQCPIQPGQSFVYNFTVTGQRGTLLWHAHILWLRATVHGAIVILPKRGVPYPFPTPRREKVIILGEWWKSDVEAVINEAMKSGMAPNVSDAHTINGYPGPVSACSSHASPFMDAPIAVDNVTATATLHYSGTLASTITTLTERKIASQIERRKQGRDQRERPLNAAAAAAVTIDSNHPTWPTPTPTPTLTLVSRVTTPSPKGTPNGCFYT